MTQAAYDAHADWYAAYKRTTAREHTKRMDALLAALLPSGPGRAVDLGCGTGAHAPAIAAAGFRVVGVDLSAGQLRHARDILPVVQADATALPLAAASLDLVACVLIHTDLPDYPAVMGEAVRVLRPGGRLVHVGTHPCYTGPFADWTDPDRLVLSPGYDRRERSFTSWAPHGVRARVGAWHLPLAPLVQAVVDAGLTITRLVEDAGKAFPDTLALVAVKPATDAGKPADRGTVYPL